MGLHLLDLARSATRRRAAKPLLIASVLVALSTLSPSTVSAQPLDPAVEALIREGLTLRRQGRDEQAFASFEAAWSASHSPRARAQMGLAAQALGRWPDADRFLREALDASADAWITERRDVLTRSLTEIDAHLGLLEVRCNLDGAEIRIDGVARGTTPLREPLRLPVGTVAVQISAPGHLEATRQAVLSAGQTTREQIDLVALPPPHVTPPTNQQVIRPPNGAVTPPVVPPPRDERHGSDSTRRTLAWATGGVAAASLIAGGVFLALRNDAASEFNARNEDLDPSNDCAQGSTAERCVSAESTVSTMGALSVVGFALGGAAAVTSAVLFLTLPSAREGGRAGLRACSASALAQGLAASCAFTF